MSRTWVVNINAGDEYDVDIRRPGPWGNPFIRGRDGTKAEVIEKFRRSVTPEMIRRARDELRGKRLGCRCAPGDCHGDVWARIADGGEP